MHRRFAGSDERVPLKVWAEEHGAASSVLHWPASGSEPFHNGSVVVPGMGGKSASDNQSYSLYKQRRIFSAQKDAALVFNEFFKLLLNFQVKTERRVAVGWQDAA